jgi:hypothetical protein
MRRPSLGGRERLPGMRAKRREVALTVGQPGKRVHQRLDRRPGGLSAMQGRLLGAV